MAADAYAGWRRRPRMPRMRLGRRRGDGPLLRLPTALAWAAGRRGPDCSGIARRRAALPVCPPRPHAHGPTLLPASGRSAAAVVSVPAAAEAQALCFCCCVSTAAPLPPFPSCTPPCIPVYPTTLPQSVVPPHCNRTHHRRQEPRAVAERPPPRPATPMRGLPGWLQLHHWGPQVSCKRIAKAHLAETRGASAQIPRIPSHRTGPAATRHRAMARGL